VETLHPPVYDRRKRKTSYRLREKYNKYDIKVNDVSTRLARQIEEAAENINIIHRPKQNKKVILVFE
jgi:hypothetical protein